MKPANTEGKMMVQKSVWCVALLLTVCRFGCGGSNPTAPPTPAPLGAGNL